MRIESRAKICFTLSTPACAHLATRIFVSSLRLCHWKHHSIHVFGASGGGTAPPTCTIFNVNDADLRQLHLNHKRHPQHGVHLVTSCIGCMNNKTMRAMMTVSCSNNVKHLLRVRSRVDHRATDTIRCNSSTCRPHKRDVQKRATDRHKPPEHHQGFSANLSHNGKGCVCSLFIIISSYGLACRRGWPERHNRHRTELHLKNVWVSITALCVVDLQNLGGRNNFCAKTPKDDSGGVMLSSITACVGVDLRHWVSAVCYRR